MLNNDKEKWGIMYQIAIDGPAGAGKSTVAKLLAKQLKILYLDTGAMYRALTYFALKQAITINDDQAVIALLNDFDLKFNSDAVFVNGEDVTEAIRQSTVTSHVSQISAIKEVRDFMVAKQREIASRKSIVLDGRDIGTVVLPDAKFKFYVTASDIERAKRRYNEQIQRGYDVSLDDILNDIRKRDLFDSSRKHAPLSVAADAEIIDTTELSIEQVVETIIKKVNNET